MYIANILCFQGMLEGHIIMENFCSNLNYLNPKLTILVSMDGLITEYFMNR